MPRPVSELARRLEGGPRSMEIHDEARRRACAGEDVIVLTVGDTDLPTPDRICAAAVRSIDEGNTHYAHKAGDPALRAALARDHARTCGVEADPAHVLVTAGAQQGIFLSLLSLVGPGDEVLLPDPYYLWHASAVRATGAVPVPVPMSPDDGFRLRPEAVAGAISPRTKAFLFNTPHNPTGRVFDAAETSLVADACIANDLWLVSDEVYRDLRHEGPFIPPASLPGMACRTLTVASFSKSHAMTGWRIGHVVSPPSAAAHLARVSACSSLSVSSFVQEAALEAVTGHGAEVSHLRAEIRRRRDVVVDGLDGHAGMRAPRPESGPFVFLDVRGLGLSGAEFCWGLLDAGVALVPGEGFGENGHGHARLSLSVPCATLARACDRIRSHADELLAAMSGAPALTGP